MINLRYHLRWLEDVFVKRSYNFGRPDVNLINFHSQILVVLAILGVFYGQRDSWFRLIWPALSVSLMFVAIGLEIMFVHQGVTSGDYSFAIECFCYLVILAAVPTVYLGIVLNKEKILNLLEDMNDDFNQVCNLGPRHRAPFLENQLLIWKLGLCWFSLSIFTACLFFLFPVAMLFYQTLFAEQNEHLIRLLPFPMWLPHDDPYRTPNYEFFLFLQMIFLIIFTQGFGGYVYLLFHFLLHYYTMMDMIILDFETIFDGLDETVASLPKWNPKRKEVQRVLNKRVGRIVTWHLSVFKALTTISSTFGPPLVYQVMFSSIAICLMIFRIAQNMEEGAFDFLFTMLIICGIMQLWIPCYLGTLLRNKGYEIADSCFNCGWNETPLGLMIRTDIVIIIFRSQIPIFIKFTGLPNIQLETFSSIMSSAYTYFNMLRQYTAK